MTKPAKATTDTMTRDVGFFSAHRSDDGALTEIGHMLRVGAMDSGMGSLSVQALHILLGNAQVAPAPHLTDEDASGEPS